VRLIDVTRIPPISLHRPSKLLMESNFLLVRCSRSFGASHLRLLSTALLCLPPPPCTHPNPPTCHHHLRMRHRRTTCLPTLLLLLGLPQRYCPIPTCHRLLHQHPRVPPPPRRRCHCRTRLFSHLWHRRHAKHVCRSRSMHH
jgi:hypothetical protein